MLDSPFALLVGAQISLVVVLLWGMDLKERPHLYRVMRALTRSAYYKVAGTRFVIDARFIVMQITNSAV